MPAVNLVGNAALTSNPDSAPGLSPDALVAFCDSRLSSLDSQMQGIFAQQNQSAATTQNLDSIASLLNDLPQPTGSSSNPKIHISDAQLRQIYAAYDTAIDDLSSKDGTPAQMWSIGEKTTLGQQLYGDVNALRLGLKGSVSSGWTLPESTITNCSQNLKTYTSNLNSDSEMQMINLQSLMSSRQTAVELSTNIMQNFSSTDMAIVANYKG
jgi:hypothetical protein